MSSTEDSRLVVQEVAFHEWTQKQNTVPIGGGQGTESGPGNTQSVRKKRDGLGYLTVRIRSEEHLYGRPGTRDASQ